MSYFVSQTITFDAAMRDLARGSAKARAAAARALADAGDPTERRRAVDALVRALDDDRPEVRAAACSSLGSLGEPGAVAPLVRRLDDAIPAVRQNAAIALGTLRAEASFEPLAQALRGGPADLRFQAATSLAEVDPPRAFEHVLAALSDSDAQVVGAAALSVGAIASELAASQPPPAEARPGAAEAPPTAGTELARRGREALAAQLDHADPGARFDVAYALADLGDRRGASVLAAATQDPDRAWDAVSALGRLGAASELAAAVEHKKTPPEAQTLAAGRLLAIDPARDRAREVLLEALGARRGYVRGIALEQLAEVGGAWARAPLEKLARSGRGADLLEPIAEALRAIADREPAP